MIPPPGLTVSSPTSKSSVCETTRAKVRSTVPAATGLPSTSRLMLAPALAISLAMTNCSVISCAPGAIGVPATIRVTCAGVRL